jgi:putative tryptophan/tyrosine transport system substrate-binding protein
MKRRDLLVLGGAAALGTVSPAMAETRPKMARIGVLLWGSPGRDVYVEPFRQGLREVGYVEERDIVLDVRFAESNRDRALAALRDFVLQKVDVIVASTTPSAHAAKSATSTIPIVMAPVADALATGLVANLARPGGNLTGVSTISPAVVAKGLETLRQLNPGLGRIAFLGSTRDPNAPTFLREIEAAAAGLGIRVQAVMVGGPEEFEDAFAAMREQAAQALIVQPIFANEGAAISELALRHRLPTASTSLAAKGNGLLIGYGATPANFMRQAAAQVDKILKGAKPGDLPVEQPTHFEFVVNLKIAKALGIDIPPSLIARADEVIE